MTTTTKCETCGEKVHGVEQYATAKVYHLECLMKATETVRAKVTALHGVSRKQNESFTYRNQLDHNGLHTGRFGRHYPSNHMRCISLGSDHRVGLTSRGACGTDWCIGQGGLLSEVR